MSKLIKVAYFPPNTPKRIVLASNGEYILDDICLDIFSTEEFSNYDSEGVFLADKAGKHKCIVEEGILKVKVQYGYEIFKICKITKDMDEVRVYVRQITIDSSLGCWLSDVRPTDLNGQASLEYMLQNTNEYKSNKQYAKDLEVFSDITKYSTAYYQDMNLYKALHDSDQSFKNRWGGEVQRRGYKISINNRIGTNRGFQIRSNKNLLGFEAETNVDSVCTRIKPKGFDGITIDGYIDSPLINNYSRIYTREIKYEDVKIKGENDDNGYDTLEEAQAELIRRATAEFIEDHIDEIQAEYTISFLDLSKTEEYKNYSILERCYIGDTVNVYEEKLGINISVRVKKIKYDILAQEVLEIELSNYDLSKYKVPSILDIKNQLEEIPSSNSILSEAKKNATDLINAGLKDSNVIVRNNEILIMDTKDINTAVEVWRWNSGALGHSKTGYYGEYSTAITMDGQIVADFINTGVLNANLIKAGILKSYNNLTWISMENGTFNFANKLKFDGSNFTIDLSKENLATNEQVKSIVDMNSNAILAQVSNSNKLIAKNVILTGDFTSSTGSSTIGSWIKNTISATSSTYATDGTNWCNFYTSTLAGELFAYQDITVEVGKPYEFSCKIAKYSTSAQHYCIRIQEYIDGTWTTKKEFTGTIDVDRSNPLVIYTKYKPTVSKVRIWIGKVDGTKFDIYATDFQLFYTTDIVKSAELKVLDEKIETKVSESDVGTAIEQNAYAVKIAWNKISNYIQFENGGLSIYNGTVNTTQKRAVFDENGNHFWRDGYYLGKIGTNQYVGDSSIKGIVFDLESQGGYMTWAVKRYSTDSTYNMMWSYANKTIGNYGSGKLHAGCDIDMHNFYLRNVNFEGGGITGTMNFVQVTSMNSNGTAGTWVNNAKLQFQNGILISGTWN